MTGFGRVEVPLPSAGRALIEVRTLNHRFLELEARLPEGLQLFEDAVRTMAAGLLRRGQVRISIQVKTEEQAQRVVFQAELARRYTADLRRFQKSLKLPGQVTLQTVLSLPQVMQAPRNDDRNEKNWPVIRRGVEQALASVVKMRRQEGARLGKSLEQILKTFTHLVGKIRQRIPVVQKELQERLADRIEAALASIGTENKSGRPTVVAEAAAFVQGSDVTEELDRIGSHLTALRAAARGQLEAISGKESKGSVGRTIDFLAQELQREVNTLGTKLRDPQVVHWVVALKGEIEKLKEQSANLE